jgi:threonine/homoserine/homoserine lactone efflux protein
VKPAWAKAALVAARQQPISHLISIHGSSAASLSATTRRDARKGLLVGLGNPKMVIFFLAFFPQFIHPGQGSQAGQMLILGAVFWVIGVIWDLAFACASGTIGAWLHRCPRLRAAQPRVEGLAYLGLAGWAAVTDR